MPAITVDPSLGQDGIGLNGVSKPSAANGINGATRNHLDEADKADKAEAQPKYTSTTYPSNCLQFLQDVPHLHLQNETNHTPTIVEQAQVKLNVLVVGAGLGGLATAVALRRRGHTVTVFEQAPELAEVGAGIQIPPNSGILLGRWGVAARYEPFVVQPSRMNFRRWQNGALIGVTDTSPSFAKRYGAPYNVVHRAHLHTAMHQQADALGVKLRLNSKVHMYDAEAPSITLSDGSVFRGDLVVAADGVKSQARDLVAPNSKGVPKPTGFAVYRATVDVDKMRAFPELSWLLDEHNLNLWIGEDRHVMTYSIAGGRSFNMVLSHRDKSTSDPATFGFGQDILSDMRREFEGWDPQLTMIISLIDKAIKTPLISGFAPLDTWLSPSSKLVLLGDAAHAMVPYMSQGAAMAVEDGAALAVALSKLTSTPDRISNHTPTNSSATSIPYTNGINNQNCDDHDSAKTPEDNHNPSNITTSYSHSQLTFALHLFQQERIRRSSMMQEASLVNSMIWHFPDGALQRARDDAMAVEVGGLADTDARSGSVSGCTGTETDSDAGTTTGKGTGMENGTGRRGRGQEQKQVWASPNQWTDPVTQNWAYGYDAEQAMEEVWERAVYVRDLLLGTGQ